MVHPNYKKELLKQGYYASIKRISRYMKRLGLRSIITKKYNPGSKSKAPNDKVNHMNREFGTSMTNEKWVMDITYIHTIYKTKDTKGIIVQSDLGSQYLSYEVEELLSKHGIIHSYSRKGNPADNSPIEVYYSK